MKITYSAGIFEEDGTLTGIAVFDDGKRVEIHHGKAIGGTPLMVEYATAAITYWAQVEAARWKEGANV